MPRGLGKGLESLIPTDIVETKYDPTAKTDAKGRRIGEEILQIELSKIDPNPHQPRKSFDQGQLETLADSIKLHGILQPLVASPSGNRYQLIAGERRLRASKLAGLKTVPVIVRSFNEQQKVELALIENLQREDLNLIEMATAYKKLVDEFNLLPAEIGKRVGKDRSTIANYMRLLALPDDAKQALIDGKISEGHGRVILTVGEPAKQAEMLKLIVEHGWSVRQTEEFGRSFKTPKGDKEKAYKRIAGIHGEDELSKELSETLGTLVRAVPVALGWRLTIHYKTEDELKKFAKLIKKSLGK